MIDEEIKQSERQRIGRRIAELRKERGLTIRQLADLCGVTNPNINKIENGRYSVGIDILNRIAAALECSIEIVPLS